MVKAAEIIVLIVSFLAQGTAQTTELNNTLNGWYNCSTFTFESEKENQTKQESVDTSFAECAFYNAPLCYDGICEDSSKRRIPIFVKRILAKESPATKPNIWFMQGGPGIASNQSTFKSYSAIKHRLFSL